MKGKTFPTLRLNVLVTLRGEIAGVLQPGAEVRVDDSDLKMALRLLQQGGGSEDERRRGQERQKSQSC